LTYTLYSPFIVRSYLIPHTVTVTASFNSEYTDTYTNTENSHRHNPPIPSSYSPRIPSSSSRIQTTLLYSTSHPSISPSLVHNHHRPTDHPYHTSRVNVLVTRPHNSHFHQLNYQRVPTKEPAQTEKKKSPITPEVSPSKYSLPSTPAPRDYRRRGSDWTQPILFPLS
jgi:hypothetical protein